VARLRHEGAGARLALALAECMSAAAFPASVGYASWPKMLA
jgi:hypothetical protein